MNPKTIEVIRKMLQNEVEDAKGKMLHEIEFYNREEYVKKAIAAYREVYGAQQDFEEWAEKQEEKE